MPVTRKRGLFGQPVSSDDTSGTSRMRAPTDKERIWDSAQDKLDWIPSILKDFVGIPSRDIPRDDTQVPAGAISWFSSKANRIASGENLIKLLRERYPDVDSNMRKIVEGAYKNYPRTFAHIGDIKDKNIDSLGVHHSENYPNNKFDKFLPDTYEANVSKPILNANRDQSLVNKLKPSIENRIAGNSILYRKNILDNNITMQTPHVNRAKLKDIDETFREEMSHAAQSIRRPFESRDDVIAGRGQLKGLHDVPSTIKYYDYKLEPVETGAKLGSERGVINRKVKSVIRDTPETAKLSPEQLKRYKEGLDPWPADLPTTSARPKQSHTEYLNDVLSKMARDFETVIGHAGNESKYHDIYSSSGKVSKKKVYSSKSEYAKSKPKTIGKAIEKINEHVLPRLNRARPADDQLVFSLQDRQLKNMGGIIKDPNSIGDFLTDIKIGRSSRLKK